MLLLFFFFFINTIRDEDPVGVWTIRAQNKLKSKSKGKLIDWTLILWGEEIDGESKEEDEDKTSKDKKTTEEKKSEVNEKPSTSNQNNDEVSSEKSEDNNDSLVNSPGDNKGINYERTHKAIVAAEFTIGIVSVAGIIFILWRYIRKRYYRDDHEFQMLSQQKQLIPDNEDDDNINMDNKETKIIFENHFLDDDDEISDHINGEDMIDLLEEDELSNLSE